MKKQIILYYISIVFLQGCITTMGDGIVGGDGPLVGPGSSSQILELSQEAPASSSRRQIEVAIPVFDPNIPADSDQWEKQGIWPELRRAESKHFSLRMKEALELTQQFGAVRVVPDRTATGELYVLGKIEESNGENVEISITVVGIDGKVWLSKSFEHRVKEHFFRSIRNKGKDPYAPVFENAAEEIVKALRKKGDGYLKNLNTLAEVRFGYSLSRESFAPFIKISGSRSELVAAPADEDAMFQRTRKLRIKDQLFIDKLQPHYETFDARLLPSYSAWQEAAFTESKAKREARKEAIGKAILGTVALVAGVLVAANNSDSNAVAEAAGVVGAAAGGLLLLNSYKTSQEAKFHHEALMELGNDIDVEIAPQVVEFEKKTVELIGNDKEQFNQWRKFLKKIYAEEATPDIQL